MSQQQSFASMQARALIDSNAREAADLVGELMLLLDHADGGKHGLAQARLLTRRLADRLAQLATLGRFAQMGGFHPDTWSPADIVEELEHEAVSLAGARLDVRVAVPDVVPRYWHFDRELVSMALGGALHSALAHAEESIGLEFGVRDGFFGFAVIDDAGAFPAELLGEGPPRFERGEMNCNALGVYFARLVASLHVNQGRQGRVELLNRLEGPGTRFTLWLP